MEILGMKGAGVNGFSSVWCMVGGGGGVTQSPNIYNVYFHTHTLLYDITR
jgi:hypothetical protein